MNTMDRLYVEVIFSLFQIKLYSKNDLDSFYDNIETHLSFEQIEILQAEMSNALHRGVPQGLDGDFIENEVMEDDIFADCPKIGEVQKLEKFLI